MNETLIEKVSKRILPVFFYWGVRSSILSKENKRDLVKNLHINYKKAPRLVRILIISTAIFNPTGPLKHFRNKSPKKIVAFIDKLFFMHLSFVEEFGLISPVNKSESSMSVKEIEGYEEIINNGIIYDYLIIGSGPGAAIAANNLPRDKRILVLEKGDRDTVQYDRKHTLANMILDFSQTGMEIVWGRKLLSYSQGSTLGGGSEVNSGLYRVLEGDNRVKIVESLSTDEETYKIAESKVRDILNPILDENINPQESILYRGAKDFNYNMKEIMRWRTFENNRWVNNSMKREIWESSDFDILTNFEVRSLKPYEKYVEVRTLNLSNKNEITFRSKKIILAAGTISTPKILKRSGLIKAREVEFNFAPMLRVFVYVPSGTLGGDDIDPFQGYNEELGLKFGSGVSTPSLLSGLLGKKISSSEAANIRSYYVSFRSTGFGGMFPNGSFYYKFSRDDKSKAEVAMEKLKELVTSGGAILLESERSDSFEEFDFSTVHIFGSLPWGSSIYSAGTSQLKIDKRICVLDASLLPFAPEVNPQALVMTLAQINIERLVANGF